MLLIDDQAGEEQADREQDPREELYCTGGASSLFFNISLHLEDRTNGLTSGSYC